MAELTREQVLDERDAALSLIQDSPDAPKEVIERLWFKVALCDLALRALDSGQREQRLVKALRIIAGEKQCVDNLMSNVDVAREALREPDQEQPK